MRAILTVTTSSTWYGGLIDQRCPVSSPHYSTPRQLSRLFNFQYHRTSGLRLIVTKSLEEKSCRLTVRENAKTMSGWDENLYSGSGYLDEEDVVTFLDPPKELIPFDPSSYNPASYLWKKIANIPEERRHHLLSLMNPRLISRAWEVAGRRYDDPKLVKKRASSLLSGVDCTGPLELWKCRTSGAPLPIAWINSFEKVLFCCSDGKAYGRLIGGQLSGIINSISSLYFSVQHVNEVMPTEQPCDLAYEFGDGLMDIFEYPQGFPKPTKHPHPFDDQVVIYIRHLGPGVLVGQAWQEGKELQQVPKKLCSEILMVKVSSVSSEKHS